MSKEDLKEALRESQELSFTGMPVQEALDILSGLSRGEYEQIRKRAAKELDFRVRVLDSEVKGR